MLDIGNLVQLKQHINQKTDYNINVYGVITKMSPGYYDSTTIYYTVLWLTTGDSYKYTTEELVKVS